MTRRSMPRQQQFPSRSRLGGATLRCVALALAILQALLTAGSAAAATIVVTEAADVLNACSLRVAVANANNDSGSPDCAAGDGDDRIVFAPSLVGATLTLSQDPIGITSNLTIEGPGASSLTVSGGDTQQIFVISDGTANRSNVTIEKLTLTEGFADGAAGAGGAISNEENLTLRDMVITGNHSATSGGAISNPGGNLLVVDSVLSANTANTGNGGAIVSTLPDGVVTLQRTTVTQNHASIGGGVSASFGVVHISDSDISGNTASAAGGGMAGSSSEIAIDNTTLNENIADSSGGAIRIVGAAAGVATIIRNSTLSDNAAGQGGAIANVTGGRIEIRDSVLSDNSADSGGAIHNTLNARLELFATQVNQNQALVGGAIHNSAEAKVLSSTLTGNIAQAVGITPRGGAIHNAAPGLLLLQFSTLLSNTAFSGGAIFNSGLATVENSTLSANNGADGGAIFNRSGVLEVSDSEISDHVGGDSGGGIHHFEGSTLVRRSRVLRNQVINDGGGLYQDRGDLTVVDSIFQANAAGIGGGISSLGLGLTGPTLATITASTFHDNIATVRGGGLYIDDLVRLDLTNSTISGNEAGQFGGGIELVGGEYYVTNTTILGNSAGNQGGGLANGLGAITDVTLTIVAGSLAGGDCVADDPDDLQHIFDLIEDGTCPSQFGTTLNVDPGLGPLQDNGGPTPTHSPMPFSPVVDVGFVCTTPGCVPGSDQRGAGRPFAGNGVLVLYDIGAVELGSPLPANLVFGDGFEEFP